MRSATQAGKRVLVVLVALAVLVTPTGGSIQPAHAAAARLHLSERTALPGATVTARLRRFPASVTVRLLFDADETELGDCRTDGHGACELPFTVPAVPAGSYRLTARAVAPEGEIATEASASLRVVESAPTVTPTSPVETAIPSATGTPEPTPAGSAGAATGTANATPTIRSVRDAVTATPFEQESIVTEANLRVVAIPGPQRVFTPVADTEIRSDAPAMNYGATSSLSADRSPARQSLLRFEVSGTGGKVVQARLRLFCKNGAARGPRVYRVTGAWSETGATWSTRPALGSTATASTNSVKVNSWIEYDVTAAVRGDGEVDLTLIPTSTDAFAAYSRDSLHTSRRPQLVVVLQSPAATPAKTQAPTSTPARTATPSDPGGVVSGNPLAGATLFVDPNSNAREQADEWRSSRPADAAEMDKIAGQPQADWIDGSGNVTAIVAARVTTIANAGALPVLVAYNIPKRDCVNTGAGSAAIYKSWIRGFASGIGARAAVVILEPDALANLSCLDPGDQAIRTELIADAIGVLEAQPNVSVYVDAGHANWVSASTMAKRLNAAGIARAQGFALNVAAFGTTADSIAFGKTLSAAIGDKHFVIDTSRNGLGPTWDNDWCNPEGRALGNRPSTVTADPLVDAYLWIKRPGESDGTCHGGPVAGQWWADYALGLAERAAF